MTISSTTNRVPFAGDGVTTAFPFSYHFQSKADLVVVLKVNATGVETIKTIVTHYNISGTTTNGVYAAGGTVTMVTAPAVGETLVIYRDPALTQVLDLVENDPMPAESIEQAFDKRAMVEQRLNERMDRTVRQRDAYTGSLDPQLPAVDLPLGVLQMNAAGTGLGWVEFDQSSLTAHIADTVDAHDASAISNAAAGNLSATTVQGALDELQGDVDTLNAHVVDATAAHAASAISNSPSGNLAASDVQTALNELQGDIDTSKKLVMNSFAIPGTVANAGTVLYTAGYERVKKYISGTPGAVTIGDITAGTFDGQELLLVGCDATNTVTIDTIGNVITKGTAILAANDSILFDWDHGQTKWVEQRRNT